MRAGGTGKCPTPAAPACRAEPLLSPGKGGEEEGREGAGKESAKAAPSIALGGGPTTPPPARPPRCAQVSGGESRARAPSCRPARRRRGAGPAPTPLSLRPRPPLCSGSAAPLRCAPTATAAAAMSADPVVFVSAARTAVGERRRRVADAGSGAGRVSRC